MIDECGRCLEMLLTVRILIWSVLIPTPRDKPYPDPSGSLSRVRFLCQFKAGTQRNKTKRERGKKKGGIRVIPRGRDKGYPEGSGYGKTARIFKNGLIPRGRDKGYPRGGDKLIPSLVFLIPKP